ncbi:MAG: CinA family protein [Burkholderiales bacterium]|jgi:nicotinamide-nucleotide amidase|nr:CinA family protein [Burkholderiales bacterium]
MGVNEIDPSIAADVESLAAALKSRGWMLATAESCTGGLIAAACTDLAGSSDWFERGVVSYSNEAKTELLGVPAELIAQHGAVSGEVVRAMADGIVSRSRAHIAVAVTGIAGPGGGSQAKPVGTIWIAIALRGQPAAATLLQLKGDRSAVRQQTVAWAMRALNVTVAAI